MLLSSTLRLNHTALTLELAKRARLAGAGAPEGLGGAGSALLLRIRPLPDRRRAGARYVDGILDGTAPTELAVKEIPDDRVRHQPRDCAPARDHGAAGRMIIQADIVYR